MNNIRFSPLFILIFYEALLRETLIRSLKRRACYPHTWQG